MRSARTGQAVILLLVVALAASCTATKEYSSKLFSPRIPAAKDSQTMALHFLDIDSADTENDNWVNTDFIMGRDTVSKTFALDKFAKEYQARKKADSSSVAQGKIIERSVTPKPVVEENAPVARYGSPGEVRSKRSRE